MEQDRCGATGLQWRCEMSRLIIKLINAWCLRGGKLGVRVLLKCLVASTVHGIAENFQFTPLIRNTGVIIQLIIIKINICKK